MTVFNVLNQTSDIFGKRILEASAGTGKTFAIEHIVVRLLIEKNSFTTIDQILVVTFTKKATKELKYRIRSNIEKAAKFLANNEKSIIFEYLIPYINNKEALYKLQNALDLFETCQIFTIHSFCFKNLKEFFVEANVFIEDENETQNTHLIKELIFDYLKFYVNPNDYSKEQIEIIIKNNVNIDDLCQRIFNEIGFEPKIKNYKSFNESYEDFLEQIKNFQMLDFNQICQEFITLENNYKKNKKFENDDFIFQLKLLVSIINEKTSSKEKFQSLLKTKCSIFEFLSENNKKKSKVSIELPEVFLHIKNILYSIIKEATDHKILFSRLLRDISSWVDNNLEKNEILTYEKILYKMKKAIQNHSFKKKVQNKYKAVIIDEFQDTDDVQFEIFDKLFFNNTDMLAVYLIGDPKQSIYSFRKADLYTYLNASTKIKEIKYLDTNFRSSKSLIESLNALFSESFAKRWLKLPQLNKSLNYIPIKSGLNRDFNFYDKLSPLHFFIAEGSFKNQRWPSDEIEQKYFIYISNEILKLKKENGFSDNNFAVLVNDRYQANRLKSFFNKHLIKSVTAKGASLKNSNVINAMKDFLEAVLHSHDLNKIKIALKGPYINLSDEAIKNLQLDKDFGFIQKFLYLRSELKKGIVYFFNSFFYSDWLGKTILENIAYTQDLNFYYETIGLVELLITQHNLSSNRILKFLAHLNDLDEDNENFELHQSVDNGVQVLTTFMAKGLEYDIVFALSLVSRNIERKKENLEEIDAEKMRQFYVALTRAKYRMYVPIAIDINEKEIRDGTYSCMDYFLSHVLQTNNFIKKDNLLIKLQELKNHISFCFIEDINIEIDHQSDETSIIKSVKKFNKKYEPSYTYSFSSLNNEQKNILDEKKQDVFLPIGPKIGIIFHKIFEKIFNYKTFEEDIIKKIIHDSLFDEDFLIYEDKIFEIVIKTLKSSLLKNNAFCIKDIPFENFKPECEFLFSIKNDYMKGFIDLIFMHKNMYYIVDWKTNFLGTTYNDYTTDSLEKEMNKHNYFLQAAIYTNALKKYLKIHKQDFKKSFGGVFYIFLRGLLFEERLGIYHFFPDLNLLDNINKMNVNTINCDYE